MYLTEADGVALLRRVVERFASGELQFDAFSRTGIRAQVVNTIVRRSGSTLHWGIDRPADIVDAVPGRAAAGRRISSFDVRDTFDTCRRATG